MSTPSMIRTPDQQVRVFVSSTLAELAPEREAVRDAITQLRLTPVLFELGARPYPPRDLYRAYLRQSDVFIGIYAESYGWIAPGMEISGLEDEYRLSAGKPRLIYTKEAAQREPRLTSFLDAIRAEGVVSYRHFDEAGELGRLVADDLALLLTERFISPPVAPPAAPLPALRWPLIDRVDELQVVTRLLRQADVGLVTLTGPGGVGKTSLALAAGHAAADEFADGAAFVSLETLTILPWSAARWSSSFTSRSRPARRSMRACSRSSVPASCSSWSTTSSNWSPRRRWSGRSWG